MIPVYKLGLYSFRTNGDSYLPWELSLFSSSSSGEQGSNDRLRDNKLSSNSAAFLRVGVSYIHITRRTQRLLWLRLFLQPF